MCRFPSFVFVFFAFALVVISADVRFRVIREWNYVNFTWPNEETFKTAMSKGLYIPENNIIAGVKYFEDFYYITLPRMKDGVPATLTRIPAGEQANTAPPLQPYPSWEMNNVGDCNALQNVQNIEVDTKGQLWIIDGGRVDTLSNAPVVKCPPKLVIFDIKMNVTTTTYQFPEEVASSNGSFLYDLVVDNTNGGYAYITDNGGKDPGIIVFSVKDNRSWKLRHAQTMRADATASHFRVGDVMLAAPINLAGIALGPKIHTSNDHIVVNDDREVYYSPLSSLHLYSINTTVLRNEQMGVQGEYQGEVKDYGIKASQSVGMVMDDQGNLYYSLLATSSVAKWDSRTSFQSGQKVIARDDKYLEWPNSLTFDSNGDLIVLVNRLNRFIYDRLKLEEPNFRLISANVSGRSYLADESYSYETKAQDRNDNDEGFNVNPPLTGTDPDPYLVPKPEPEPTPEPTAMPGGHVHGHDLTPEDHSNHAHNHDGQMQGDSPVDHSGHDHSGHEHVDGGLDMTETKRITSGAGKVVFSVVGLVAIGFLRFL